MDDPLTGWLTRVLLGALFVVCSVGIMVRTSLTIQQRMSFLVALLAAICAAFLCAISLTVVPQAWLPSFRNMWSIGVVWAGVALLAFDVSSGCVRKLFTCAIALIMVGFIGSNNEIMSDQQRTNVRDIAMMNRIANRIQKLENFPAIRRLVFVGTNAITLSDIHTRADLSDGWHAYGTTLSVFAVHWPGYLVALYDEVTGAQLGYQTTPTELSSIEKSCVGERWPSRGSVFGEDDLAIICLGDPARVAVTPLDR